MSNLIEITEQQYNSPLFVICSIYGSESIASNTSKINEFGEWVSVPYAIVLPDDATQEQILNIEGIINSWNTLTLAYANNQVTVNPAGNYACYLWIDIGSGYIEQENQEPFTTNDSILEGLTEPGKYIVFAVDETTMKNGYVEFEVT